MNKVAVHFTSVGGYSQGILGSLNARVRELIRLRECCHEYLSPELWSACEVVNYLKGCMVILAQHGAIATRLRQHIPGLTEHLNSKGWVVTEITIKINPLEF